MKKRRSRKMKISTNALLMRLRTRMVLTPAGTQTTAKAIELARTGVGAKANLSAEH